MLSISPTGRCNLECRHCSSMSGPRRTEVLQVETVERAITDAAGLGYEIVTFTGGEPLLYRGLERLLRRCQAEGLTTELHTNGTLLGVEPTDALTPYINTLCVSIDGYGTDHDHLRAQPGGFDAMLETLRRLSRAVQVEVQATLHRDNIERIEELLVAVRDAGAACVRLRPLRLQGRAAMDPGIRAAVLDPRDLERIHRTLIAEWSASFVGVCGVTPSHATALVTAALATDGSDLALLAPSLAIDATGEVYPLDSILPRETALGSLLDAPLKSLAEAWTRRSAGALYRQLLSVASSRAAGYDERSLLDWPACVAAASERFSA